jgi:hypothetical protein
MGSIRVFLAASHNWYKFDLAISYTLLPANFGEIGRLFGVKTAGCSGKSATPWVAPD